MEQKGIDEKIGNLFCAALARDALATPEVVVVRAAPAVATCKRLARRRGAGAAMILPLLLLAGLSHPLASRAHPGIHEQEAAADKALEQSPEDPVNYIVRGKLHYEVGNWDAALEAFHQARSKGAAVETIAPLQGNTYLAAGWPRAAKRRFDEALQSSPTLPRARIGRARTWMMLGKPAEAEADFAVAFETLDRVRPALILERRSALLAAGRPAAAIALLDARIASMGLIPSLEIAAVDIDVETRHFDRALKRIEALLEQSPHHPLWATRRAEILQQAGREEEARAAYRATLTFVHARNARGSSRRLVELEKQLRAALAAQPAAPTRQGEP